MSVTVATQSGQKSGSMGITKHDLPGSESDLKKMVVTCGGVDEVVALHDGLCKQVRAMRKDTLRKCLVNFKLDDDGKVDLLKDRLQGFLTDVCLADVEPQASGSVSSRGVEAKKKWRITDPAEIAPNDYHEDLFRANFPLVEIIKAPPGTRMPVLDKFEGISLDPAETEAARRRWSKRLQDVEFSYTKPSDETQAFPHHMAFLEAMTQFTTPPPELYEKLEISRKRKRVPGGEQHCWEGLGAGDEDGYHGFSIKPCVENFEGVLGRTKVPPANRGSGIVPEGSADLVAELQEQEDIPTGFADAVLFVHDRRPLLRASKKHKVVNTERAAGVLERKFGEDESKDAAPFQGAYYALKYSMLNLQSGHGTPLYVLVMTAGKWTYGILVPEGYVQLLDGGIDPASLETFRGHQEITSVRENDLESLQEKLAEGTKFYRKNFRNNPHATFRDGPMPVGQLYIREEWFCLPTTEHGGFGTGGACRLFDGLLRLILGDSAKKMTAADFEQRVKLRKAIRKELEADLW